MHMRNAMTGMFCGLAIGALAAEPAPIVIPETPPPKLDGTLDDPAWQNAAKIEQLYLAQYRHAGQGHDRLPGPG